MKIIFRAFCKFVKEIWEDIMLAAIIFVPILMGILFKFGIPSLEKYLCYIQNKNSILSEYYLLFDLCIICVTPIMFSFSGVMVILGEIDSGIAKYLVVTPLGKKGYVISRIGISATISVIYNIVLLFIFRISNISMLEIVLSSIIAGIMGIMVSFFIIAYAHNKVEGMALSKFSGVLLFGLVGSLLVKAPMKYIASILPTFWITEYCYKNNYLYFIISLSLCILFSYLLYKKYEKKLI